MGGRCDDGTQHEPGSLPSELCRDGLRNAYTPTDMYIANVGDHADGTLDMRVTNMSEYRPWNALLNGIVRRDLGGRTGDFAAINLMAPRSPQQPRHWHSSLTFVQLRYEFVLGGEPKVLQKTFLTFYDLDSTRTPLLTARGHVELPSIPPLAAWPPLHTSHGHVASPPYFP